MARPRSASPRSASAARARSRRAASIPRSTAALRPRERPGAAGRCRLRRASRWSCSSICRCCAATSRRRRAIVAATQIAVAGRRRLLPLAGDDGLHAARRSPRRRPSIGTTLDPTAGGAGMADRSGPRGARRARERRAALGDAPADAGGPECRGDAERGRRLGGHPVRDGDAGGAEDLSSCRGCCADRPAPSWRCGRRSRRARASCCSTARSRGSALTLDEFGLPYNWQVGPASRDIGDASYADARSTRSAARAEAAERRCTCAARERRLAIIAISWLGGRGPAATPGRRPRCRSARTASATRSTFSTARR